MQHPRKLKQDADNCNVKINDYISANLVAWMNASVTLNNCKKVGLRAGIGTTTVQRMEGGIGDPRVGNLVAVAKAFGRPVEDLLANPNIGDNPSATGNIGSLGCSKIAREIAELVDGMEEDARWKIYGEARMLARLHPMKKPALKNPTQE